MQKRNIKHNIEDILTLSTMSLEVAISCFYTNFSDGKPFTGVSVRLAEIIASTWGNINTGANIVKNDGKYIYVKGFVQDLEKNSNFEMEIIRGITKYNGVPMSGEELQRVSSACCSIAFRNAILKAIPASYVIHIIKKIKKYVNENIHTDDWEYAIAFFTDKGVSEGELLSKFAPENKVWDDNSVLTLLGVKNAIEDGDAAIFDLFPKASIKKKSQFSDIPEQETIKSDSTKTDTSFLADFLNSSEEGKEQKKDKKGVESDVTGTRNLISSLSKEEVDKVEKELPPKPAKRGRGRPRKNQK